MCHQSQKVISITFIIILICKIFVVNKYIVVLAFPLPYRLKEILPNLLMENIVQIPT